MSNPATTLDVEIELPDGTVVSGTDAPAQAAADGFPMACQWFAACDRPADVALSHPALTAVLTCNRCAAKARVLADDGIV